MKTSRIGWTDYSGGCLNFVTGCTPVSAGCRWCYARAIYERFGRDHSVVQVHPDKLANLHTMRFPRGSKSGETDKPKAFVCDTGDLFHMSVPSEFIWDALSTMTALYDVNWQVLNIVCGRREACMYTCLWRIRRDVAKQRARSPRTSKRLAAMC